MKNKNLIRLDGKVGIVTGAGSGIGEAIAHKFSQAGAKVVCAGLPGDPLEDVAAAIRALGGKAVAFEGDLSSPDQARACIDFAVKTFRKLDILVSNAGVYLTSDKTDEISTEAFMRTIHANISATFFLTRAALPELRKTHGVVLATSSVAGLKGEPTNTVYGGTKGFINSFMQGLAVEQAPHGIRVNCVLPGVTDTAMTHARRAPLSADEASSMTEGIPMKRRGTPEEIANAFAFLASDLASYVNGVLLPVDGAFTVAWGGEVDDVPAHLRRKPKGDLDRVLKHSRDGGFKKNNPKPMPH